MDKYFDRMPLRTVRVINLVIALSGLCALVAVFVLALPDTRRPASQMPWYFWVLVLYMTFIPLYTPPGRLGSAADVLSFTAWAYTIVGIAAVVLFMFAVLATPLTATMVVFCALGISYGLRGAQALLRKRRQPNRAPASK